MVENNGYVVTIGNDKRTVLEVYLDRHTSNARSEKYINALHKEVDNYIKGLTEKPEYFCVSSLINQSYDGRNERKFYFTPTGMMAARCTLISSDEAYNDNFIKRIIPIMGNYWIRGDE